MDFYFKSMFTWVMAFNIVIILYNFSEAYTKDCHLNLKILITCLNYSLIQL